MNTLTSKNAAQIHRNDWGAGWLAAWLTKMKLQGMTATAAIGFLAVAGFAQELPAQPVKNIVLVHGAFADGSSWAKVIKILQAKGYNVTAVQIPLTSFADDIAATKRVLAAQTGPVILVGHSWGGVIITEVGMATNVAGLVYVAALAPDMGETASDIGKKYPPPPSFTAPIVDKQGFMSLSTDAIPRCSPRRKGRLTCRPSTPRYPTSRGRRSRPGLSSAKRTRQSRPMKSAFSRRA